VVVFVDEATARSIRSASRAWARSASSNAIYHATGKRVRDLPIAIDKLLRQ
jgi:hypothetical protein